jgi:multimeric flavodoxin WrbA
MNVVAIYSSERKGSTYNIVRLFHKRLISDSDTLTEFFLPTDMPYFCVGCSNCFAKGEAYCPHHASIAPICKAMTNADLLIFSSPVYVLRVSGQMKALLDHFAFQFMIHRPQEEMFSKIALVITTGAGGGMKGVIKDIKASLDMWGIGSVFTYGKAVFASDWDGVSEKNKALITVGVDRISAKIITATGHVRPRMKVKLLFYIFRMMHRKIATNQTDKEYWQSKGWLDKARPW